MFAGRSALGANAATLRKLIAARIGLDAEPRGVSPRVTGQGESEGEGYRIERLLIETEPGVEIPADVLTPALGGGAKPAVLYLNPAGRFADAKAGGDAPDGDMVALAKAGHVVLAPGARGFGENPPRGSGGYNTAWQTSMRAMLIGRTVIGIQITDALRSFDYLAGRAGVDRTRISVFGKGHGGVLALYAAALEPRIHKVASEGAVLSYMDIVRAPFHEGMAPLIVPGVLKDFDLPDLARAIGPRTLWMIEPKTPAGARAALPSVAPAYAGYRPEGWTFEKVYAAWLVR
jgi:hypothetical protein